MQAAIFGPLTDTDRDKPGERRVGTTQTPQKRAGMAPKRRKRQYSKYDVDISCEICGSPYREATMLLCDGCWSGFHRECLPEEHPERYALDDDTPFLCVRCQSAGQVPVLDEDNVGRYGNISAAQIRFFNEVKEQLNSYKGQPREEWFRKPNTRTLPSDDPQDYAVKDMFFWAPEMFYVAQMPKNMQGLPCPHCRKMDVAVPNGWGDPRRIYCVEDVCFLVSKRYICKHGCGKTFAGHCERFRELLPAGVQMLFPFNLTTKAGVDEALLRQIRVGVTSAAGIAGTHKQVKSHYASNFLKEELRFLTLQRDCGRGAEAKHFVKPHQYYHGPDPTASYLTYVFRKDHARRSLDLDRLLQQVDGEILSVDASYKFSSRVRLPIAQVDGYVALDEPASERLPGLVSVANGYHQIVGYAWGNSLSVVQPMLRGIAKRYILQNFKKVQAVYTDRCCGDRKILSEAFGFDVSPAPQSTAPRAPTLAWPPQEGWRIKYATSREECDRFVNCILGTAKDGPPAVLGFDMEWEPGIPLKVMKDIKVKDVVSTIQLCDYTQKTVYVFHVALFCGNDSSLPRKLEDDILGNKNILKMGVNIANDVNRLRNLKKKGELRFVQYHDVRQEALSHHYIPQFNVSLKTLVEVMMKKTLKKNKKVRLSFLDSPLDTEQLEYAALDAYAASHIAQLLANVTLAQHHPKKAAYKRGARVQIYKTNLREVVAYATVNEDVSQRLQIPVTVEEVLCKAAKVPVTGERFLDYGPNGNMDGEVLNVPNHLARLRPENSELGDFLAASYLQSEDFVAPPEVPVEPSLQRELDQCTDTLTAAKLQEELRRDESKDNSYELDFSEDGSPELLRNGQRILVDLFHLERRMLGPLNKGHGAYRAFCVKMMASLYDLCERDVAGLKASLQAKHGWNQERVEVEYKTKFSYFRCKANKRIPEPNILLQRWLQLQRFGHIKDATTALPLFNAEAWKTFKTIGEHIIKGCVSDPPDAPLYYGTGRYADGREVVKCARGTNALESFHQKLMLVVRANKASLEYGEALLKEFAYQWNMKQAVLNRGLDELHAWNSDYDVVHNIQDVSMQLWGAAEYANFPSIHYVEDTGERFGSTLESLAQQEAFCNIDDDCEDDFGDEYGEDEADDSDLYPLVQQAGACPSKKRKRPDQTVAPQNPNIPRRKQLTDVETKKFYDIMRQVMEAPGGEKGATMTFFGRMAKVWNRMVRDLPPARRAMGFFKKTAQDLKDHDDLDRQRRNRQKTMSAGPPGLLRKCATAGTPPVVSVAPTEPMVSTTANTRVVHTNTVPSAGAYPDHYRSDWLIRPVPEASGTSDPGRQCHQCGHFLGAFAHPKSRQQCPYQHGMANTEAVQRMAKRSVNKMAKTGSDTCKCHWCERYVRDLTADRLDRANKLVRCHVLKTAAGDVSLVDTDVRPNGFCGFLALLVVIGGSDGIEPEDATGPAFSPATVERLNRLRDRLFGRISCTQFYNDRCRDGENGEARLSRNRQFKWRGENVDCEYWLASSEYPFLPSLIGGRLIVFEESNKGCQFNGCQVYWNDSSGEMRMGNFRTADLTIKPTDRILLFQRHRSHYRALRQLLN